MDVVLDIVGGSYVAREIDCLANGGRIVMIAFLEGRRGTVDFSQIILRRLTITGSTLRSRPVKFKAAIARKLRELVWPLIEAGRIKPVVYRTFPLEQAADTHRLMESSEHIGKIVCGSFDRPRSAKRTFRPRFSVACYGSRFHSLRRWKITVFGKFQCELIKYAQYCIRAMTLEKLKLKTNTDVPYTKAEDFDEDDHFRFHRPHAHLAPPFGSDWFGRKAESFARFFGTPFFLISQTVVVALWIGANFLSLTGFDPYPFILLNLAFSLQAAYAAPLILLAQTRQAERDHLHAQADAQHREALADASEQRQAIAAHNTAQLIELLEKNTQLTELVKQLTEHIDTLTVEIHSKLQEKGDKPL